MRSFPSAPYLDDPSTPAANDVRPSRGRRLSALLVGTVAAVAIAAPVANADDEDDLKNEQNQVENQIDQAHDDLHESSKRVARIVHRLESAVDRLGSARERLQTVRRDLWDAREERARLARALVRAEDRFERVSASLRAARAEVAAQRELVRNTVLGFETRANTDLAVLDAVTSSGSIQELLVAQTAGVMILGREDQALADYETAEAALAEWKDEVRQARDEVARQKDEARRNLERIRGLFESARTTRVEIASLVEESRSARQAAVRARQADRAALERLKKREERIKAEILALAQQDDGPSYSGDTDGLLQAPVDGPVTSPFGYREHPIYGYWGLHDGTDFGAGCGSALWAGESGTVINTYYDEVYGNRLYLSVGSVNGANLTLVYNHLSSYEVSEGARVGRGDVVGYVGSTGWSTGCHLHFTVLRNGEPVDPMNYL
ncbi:peptidoglycan DD-metalloendopeptidase family protein [Nocardioides stalactiti]|uniref:peptidoglycan DD-metalloendopeptidase family protein n=1 Tax=Nocardioides stalactiti TaxID=2755356 RepID=UPI0016027676|nr:M23 family metallopeptidase [Nocardioides stalactiti]